MPRRKSRLIRSKCPELPNEVYLYILEYLSILERIKIMRVNKQVRLMVVILNHFQYIRFVFTSPVFDGVFVGLNVHETKIFRSVNSIIVNKSSIIIDSGYFYGYEISNGIVGKRKQIETLHLVIGDQIKLHGGFQIPKLYIDNKIFNRKGTGLNYYHMYSFSITVSKLHVIIVRKGNELPTISLYYRSENDYRDYFGFELSIKNQTYFKELEEYPSDWCNQPYSKHFDIKGAIVAACDSKENIYILTESGTITKLDYYKQCKTEISTNIQTPIWFSIDSNDRMFICNRHTIYICGLDGSILFMIGDNSIFKDLRCLAFDSIGNLFVVDDHTVFRVCL